MSKNLLVLLGIGAKGIANISTNKTQILNSRIIVYYGTNSFVTFVKTFVPFVVKKSKPLITQRRHKKHKEKKSYPFSPHCAAKTLLISSTKPEAINKKPPE